MAEQGSTGEVPEAIGFVEGAEPGSMGDSRRGPEAIEVVEGAEPIRNLQIITSPGVGGREIVAPVLARALASQGHPTWLMCRPGTLVERLGREWGLRVSTTGLSGYCDPIQVWNLARFLRNQRIQIIHSHWSKDLSNVILASGLAGRIPVVLTKHVYATDNKHDPFHAWVARHTDIFIGVSRLVSDNVIATLRVPREKVVTVYNGIDLAHWNPNQAGLRDLHADLGVPDGKPILGYAGRINHGKGPHLILEAFAGLAGDFPEWHLVLAGKPVGADEETYALALRERAKVLGLDSRVHFPGYRPDMPEVMRTFEIFACASAFESLGMVLVEAMAMERAVVGPNTGGVPEIIESGVNGLLFRYPEVADLKNKLAWLMRNPGERKRLGRAGRETVVLKFDLDGMARQVVGIFKHVLGKGSKVV